MGYALYALLVGVVVWTLYAWWGSRRKLNREAKDDERRDREEAE